MSKKGKLRGRVFAGMNGWPSMKVWLGTVEVHLSVKGPGPYPGAPAILTPTQTRDFAAYLYKVADQVEADRD